MNVSLASFLAEGMEGGIEKDVITQQQTPFYEVRPGGRVLEALVLQGVKTVVEKPVYLRIGLEQSRETLSTVSFVELKTVPKIVGNDPAGRLASGEHGFDHAIG